MGDTPGMKAKHCGMIEMVAYLKSRGAKGLV